jgi:hypothetical protein
MPALAAATACVETRTEAEKQPTTDLEIIDGQHESSYKTLSACSCNAGLSKLLKKEGRSELGRGDASVKDTQAASGTGSVKATCQEGGSDASTPSQGYASQFL